MSGRSKTSAVFWSIYLVIYGILVAIHTLSFFHIGSGASFFNHFLLPFHAKYMLRYCLYSLAMIMTGVSLLPLLLYVLQVKVLTNSFWKLLLALRLGADLFGRSYEFLFLRSIFYQDFSAALFIMTFALLLVLPSYLAHYRYAVSEA